MIVEKKGQQSGERVEGGWFDIQVGTSVKQVGGLFNVILLQQSQRTLLGSFHKEGYPRGWPILAEKLCLIEIVPAVENQKVTF